MAIETLTTGAVAALGFPEAEVKRRLRIELQKIEAQGNFLRPEWEPLLDSKRVVGTVLALEDLFPFKIPPDKVVRKGGYATVNEATDDMCEQVKKIYIEKNILKVRK
jgi:hypothetical protein